MYLSRTSLSLIQKPIGGSEPPTGLKKGAGLGRQMENLPNQSTMLGYQGSLMIVMPIVNIKTVLVFGQILLVKLE